MGPLAQSGVELDWSTTCRKSSSYPRGIRKERLACFAFEVFAASCTNFQYSFDELRVSEDNLDRSLIQQANDDLLAALVLRFQKRAENRERYVICCSKAPKEFLEVDSMVPVLSEQT